MAKAAAILRASHGLPDSSVRGRRSELAKRGELAQVGKTDDGRAVWDVKGIVRKPVSPPMQLNLLDR
jgi:hypothetical protein